MGVRVGCVSAILLWMALGHATGLGSLQELRQETDRWIGIRNETARFEAEWRSEKEVLEGSRDLLQREQARLTGNIATLESANQLYLSNLARLQERLSEHEAARSALKAFLDQAEVRLAALVMRLPPVLQQRLTPLRRKLGEDELSQAARVQNLVAIMTQIDQFNNSLTLAHEVRQDPGGREYNVKVLYWGLSQGFAVSLPGNEAWIVRPYRDGWVWENRNDLASDISGLVAVYENEASPRLVGLPSYLVDGGPER